jgi:hypothetical protein
LRVRVSDRVLLTARRDDALVIAQQDDTIRFARRRAAVELARGDQIVIGACLRSSGTPSS